MVQLQVEKVSIRVDDLQLWERERVEAVIRLVRKINERIDVPFIVGMVSGTLAMITSIFWAKFTHLPPHMEGKFFVTTATIAFLIGIFICLMVSRSGRARTGEDAARLHRFIMMSVRCREFVDAYCMIHPHFTVILKHYPVLHPPST